MAAVVAWCRHAGRIYVLELACQACNPESCWHACLGHPHSPLICVHLQAVWGSAYYSLEEPLYVTQVRSH